MSPHRIVYLTLPQDYNSGQPHKKLDHHIYRCKTLIGKPLIEVYHESKLGRFHSSHGVDLNAILFSNDAGDILTVVPRGNGPIRVTMSSALILFYKGIVFHYLYLPTYHQVQVDGDLQGVSVKLYRDSEELDRNTVLANKADGRTLVDLEGAFQTELETKRKHRRWLGKLMTRV